MGHIKLYKVRIMVTGYVDVPFAGRNKTEVIKAVKADQIWRKYVDLSEMYDRHYRMPSSEDVSILRDPSDFPYWEGDALVYGTPEVYDLNMTIAQAFYDKELMAALPAESDEDSDEREREWEEYFAFRDKKEAEFTKRAMKRKKL